MKLFNIPVELQMLKQWVCAKADSKAPMRAKSSFPASSTDPTTWSLFEDAVESVRCKLYDNIGFVFNDTGLVGVDIDTGYDDDGFLTEIASDIIGKCKSYTEISRSGRGVHILLKGTLPFKGKNNLSGVEIYKDARYFIMTGDTLIYDTIVENQEAIDYIVSKYFSSSRESKGTSVFDSRIYNPQWTKSEDKIKLRPVYPRIPDGCRNICLTSLAGMLHNQGYTKSQIFDELMYCNKVACEPMLDEGEIRTIVGSVTRYKR